MTTPPTAPPAAVNAEGKKLTPGYDRRLTIFFKPNGHGELLCYTWWPPGTLHRVKNGRAIRVPYYDGYFWQQDDLVDVIHCRPGRRCHDPENCDR